MYEYYAGVAWGLRSRLKLREFLGDLIKTCNFVGLLGASLVGAADFCLLRGWSSSLDC